MDKLLPKWKQMSRAFRSLDKGRTGTLSPQDFSKVLTSHMAQAESSSWRSPSLTLRPVLHACSIISSCGSWPSLRTERAQGTTCSPTATSDKPCSAPSRRVQDVQRPSTAAVASKPTTVQASAAADPSATSSAPLPVPSKSGGTIAISKECLRSHVLSEVPATPASTQDKLRHGVVDTGIFCQVVEKLGIAMSTDDFKPAGASPAGAEVADSVQPPRPRPA